MTISLKLIAISSLFIYGLNYAIEYGPLKFLQRWVFIIINPLVNEEDIPTVIKPLYKCVVCMSSVWGSLLYILFTPFQFQLNYFVIWAVVVMCIAGLNRVLKTFIQA